MKIECEESFTPRDVYSSILQALLGFVKKRNFERTYVHSYQENFESNVSSGKTTGSISSKTDQFLVSNQNTLKSFCLRDRGKLGNEGRPISVHKVVMWTYVVCQSFRFNDFFLAEFGISAPQGSPEADFQCNFGRFSISLLATCN